MSFVSRFPTSAKDGTNIGEFCSLTPNTLEFTKPKLFVRSCIRCNRTINIVLVETNQINNVSMVWQLIKMMYTKLVCPKTLSLVSVVIIYRNCRNWPPPPPPPVVDEYFYISPFCFITADAMNSLVTKVLELSNKELDLPVDVVDLGSSYTPLNTPTAYSDTTTNPGLKQNYLRELADPSTGGELNQRESNAKCCS